MDAENKRIVLRAFAAVFLFMALLEIYSFYTNKLSCVWYPEEFSIQRFEHMQQFNKQPLNQEKFEVCAHLLEMRGLDLESVDALRTKRITEPILVAMFTKVCESLDDSEWMLAHRECMKKFPQRDWELDALKMLEALKLFLPYAIKCLTHPLSSECVIWETALARLNL